jgi:hypothetical protein
MIMGAGLVGTGALAGAFRGNRCLNSETDKEGFERCVDIVVPLVVGAPLLTYGLVVHFQSKSNTKTPYRGKVAAGTDGQGIVVKGEF